MREMRKAIIELEYKMAALTDSDDELVKKIKPDPRIAEL